jgi:hypothetical protein
MFKFVVALFLVTNGIPSDKPIGEMTYNQASFETEQACKAFPETDAGKAAIEYVNQLVASKQGGIIAKFACLKPEDNSI